MINYKKTHYKELSGNYQAMITGVEVTSNQFFDPERDNSTENVLDITFDVTDPETWEISKYTQRFVAPLTFGNGLFQQLLDVYGFKPEEEGGEFDEQSLVGLHVVISITKNKKGYATIESVKADSKWQKEAKKALTKKLEEPDETPKDLPFDK